MRLIFRSRQLYSNFKVMSEVRDLNGFEDLSNEVMMAEATQSAVGVIEVSITAERHLSGG